MTKKDYERAATLVQSAHEIAENDVDATSAHRLCSAFCIFFADDNPRFDEARFRAACVPGANIKARPRKGS